MHTRTYLRVATAPIAIGAALLSQPVLAQASDEDVLIEQAQATTTASTPIVVTGTRIARNPDDGSPIPIQSVTAETLELSGSVDPVETLRDIPALSNSTSGSDTALNDELAGQDSLGQSTLDLRGLGPERTLVLVDGKRHVSGVAGAQIVDVGTIPTALIQRVDVLTGGASAIYGADAVTGVINFILRDDFEGIQVDAEYGVSSEGDGDRYSIDITAGRNFADGRGNITFSGGYFYDSPLRKGDRDWAAGNQIVVLGNEILNPDSFFQSGEIGSSTPNFQNYYSLANGFYPYGFDIPTDAADFIADYNSSFGVNPTLTSAELALIDRATNAPTYGVGPNATFPFTGPYGVIAPGDFDVGGDINNNGIDDCAESFEGYNSSLAYGNSFGLLGGCYSLDAAGNVSVYQDGLISGVFNQYGGDGGGFSYSQEQLIPKRQGVNLTFNTKYEASDSVEVFVNAKFSHTEAQSFGFPNTFYDLLTVAPDNPFIPTALQPLSAAAGGLYITVDPLALPGAITEPEQDTYRLVGGLRGDLSNDLSYEIFGNYGRTDRQTYNRNEVILDRFFASIDAVDEGEYLTGTPNGNVVCRSDLDPAPAPTTIFNIPGFDPGYFTFNPGDGRCAPTNILGGANAFSFDALDFFLTDTVERRSLQQLQFGGTLVGESDVFSMPGGPIGFVLGLEYRKEKSSTSYGDLQLGVIPVTTPDANAGDLISDLGFTQNTLLFDGDTLYNNARGSFDVYEVFGEVRLPLLADMPFARNLEVSSAVRFSNYSTVGSTFAWNANGLYEPVDGLRFRGSYAKSVRAPNISELFNPLSPDFERINDPCSAANVNNGVSPANRLANCVALLADLGIDAYGGGSTYMGPPTLTARRSGSTVGNPDLQEETSKSYTLGVQFQPTFLPGLILGADYYNISIEDGIDTISLQTAANACVDSSSIDNQYCDIIIRNPTTGSFDTFINPTLNFARLETSGIDLSARYGFDFGNTDITLQGQATWVNKLNRFFDPTDFTNVDPALREYQNPVWQGQGSVTIEHGPVLLNWSTRYIGEQALRRVQVETALQDYGPAAFADDKFIHNLSGRVELTDAYTIYGGINNVTNEKPYITDYSYPVSGLGRYFFIGGTAEF